MEVKIIMTDLYTYTQKRSEINRPINFIDSKQIMRISLLPEEENPKSKKQALEKMHVRRDPNQITISNFPKISENIVNSERISTKNKTIYHYEGGWPKDLVITNNDDKKKYIKKKLEKNAENHDKFTPSVKKMLETIQKVISQNNEIDMFEEYFEGEEPEHSIEPLNVKTLKLFKNNSSTNKKSVTSLSWHPDGPYKLAASYSEMSFQPDKKNDNTHMSCIWDINNPNIPCEVLDAPSPVVKMAYNHKHIEQLAFGCYNGTVGLWDLRQNRKKPAQMSRVEISHHEPVFDLLWLSSKGGNEFVTTSTDGKVIWWDYRDLSKRSDFLDISETMEKTNDKIIGGTSLEYVADYGPKYLIGTELGSIMLATKKPKKKVEINYYNSFGLTGTGRHLGPVYRIKRNPFNPRFFMSIGDWSVNIFEDELKTPLITSRYHQSLLTDGAWSPSRPGLFFVTRKDGWLDIWDYYYRQNEVALSHKVSDYALTCISLNKVVGVSQIGGGSNFEDGRFCVVGDSNETITLLKLCDSLCKQQNEEKSVILEILEREKRREESLKKRKLERDVKRNLALKEKERREKEESQKE